MKFRISTADQRVEAVTPPNPDRQRTHVTMAVLLALIVMTLCYGLEKIGQVWQIDIRGISRATGTVPYWDFSNLWTGAKLAMTGRMALLFDTAAYRDAMAALLHAPITSGEWSYPPTMLLLGMPFAEMPIGFAYGLWTFGTIAIFAAVVFTLRLPLTYSLIAIVSPALVWNCALGQNGALTGALLLAGLVQSDRRPFLSGFFLGCLVIKPHLAILAPCALAAQRNWRALASAAATASILVLLSVAIFGWGAWHSFFTYTEPLMQRIMEAPFPQDYQVRSTTIFTLARALGLETGPAYAAQLAGIIAAVMVTCRYWSRPVARPQLRIAATITLTYLAMPYGYTYDMVGLAAAIAMLLHETVRDTGRTDMIGVANWVMPCMPLLSAPGFLLPIAPILLIPLAVRCVSTALRDEKRIPVSLFQSKAGHSTVTDFARLRG